VKLFLRNWLLTREGKNWVTHETPGVMVLGSGIPAESLQAPGLFRADYKPLFPQLSFKWMEP